jgi:ATP-dependent protease ClpP protease subunit
MSAPVRHIRAEPRLAGGEARPGVTPSPRAGGFSERSRAAKRRLAALRQSGPVVITIHGEITQASAIRAVTEIHRAKRRGAELIAVDIDSPGGRVSAARSIVGALERAALPICCHVSGDCQSAACEILVAGHVRTASRRARIMLHRATVETTLASAKALGVAGLREIADDLDQSDRRVLREMALRNIRLKDDAVARYEAGHDVDLTLRMAIDSRLIISIEE